jgi:hypothetical protein
MPPRLTRSAARLAASQAAAQSSASAPDPVSADTADTQAGTNPTSDIQPPTSVSRKRKSRPSFDTAPSETTDPLPPSSTRRSKRQKGPDVNNAPNPQTPAQARLQTRKGTSATMSGQEYVVGATSAVFLLLQSHFTDVCALQGFPQPIWRERNGNPVSVLEPQVQPQQEDWKHESRYALNI